jgi:hypothetical protein
LVEDHAAHQLDVEVAHPEGPLHRLAGHREDVRQDVVEGRLELGLLALAAGLGDLAAALEIRVAQLVLGRLAGDGRLADLLADQVEAFADLVVREGGDVGLELVDLVDQGLDASDLAVVRVDETGKKSHGRCSIGWVRPDADRRPAVASGWCRARGS